ncbi:MAG: WYL domain-containing protein [Bacteroidetes bacterium]|nr:WYL domain-containing protein [Bacteroidota bacterium]
MATNKHALIRYHALDQCFSNPGKRYFIDDLIAVCNDALYAYTGASEGVKRRQIFEDIKFMESEQGWSVPLERFKDGKQVYYRYSERNYSIKNQVVNESEAKQLKETLSILTRFKGMPQFEWMEEMLIRIESAFNLKDSTSVIVGFEHNPYLKGLNHFTEIFNSIHYKRVLKIEYQGFKQIKSSQVIFHPYFLKQYNSRWFLFGYNEAFNAISNLALDRIVSLKAIGKKYQENDAINFEEYFDDVVGVTVSESYKPIIIQLEIAKSLWPYIESKPIHGSQRIISKKQSNVIIELEVHINYELITTIFSFGEGIKVLQPEEVRVGIMNKANALLNNYL